ncbi:MAG: GntR family transcriptional regulator [Gemmatimonadaceae bacterium]|nr:GntR family transcriptional regulator [Gemmatimonadaceae bacterium]
MSIFLKPNPSSGIPIYVQLKEQIRHTVETGALQPGDPLPTMRVLAETLVVNFNTIARVYRELDQEGVLELRHGVGAFVSEFGPFARHVAQHAERVTAAQATVAAMIRNLRHDGVGDDAIRRLVEAELTAARPNSRNRTSRSPSPASSSPSRRDS